MNDKKSVDAIVSSISTAKIKPYKGLGFKNDWELVQGYFLLLDVSSHFVAPLQLLEVSLRNKMHTAIWKLSNKEDWYKTIPISKDSKRQVAAALESARKDVGRAITTDDVICRLMMGFWVYMLDSPYRTTGRNNLWQKCKDDVFPEGKPETIASIFDELKALNKLRNRLFHHEPIWKASGINNMTLALARISSQYDRVLKVLNWISPEKHSVVLGLKMKTRFDAYCQIASFNPSLSAEEEAEKLKAEAETEALKAKEEALKTDSEVEVLKEVEELKSAAQEPSS
jgi:hypothetical protein